MYVKKIALSAMLLLAICLDCADAMAQAEVVLLNYGFSFRKGFYKGVEVEVCVVKGAVKNVGRSDAKNVRIRVDCRGCYPQFDSNASIDQWGQTTGHHTIKYVAAGDRETFQFHVAARRRGNLKPSLPEGIRLEVQGGPSQFHP
jgi:hypothetical protein